MRTITIDFSATKKSFMKLNSIQFNSIEFNSIRKFFLISFFTGILPFLGFSQDIYITSSDSDNLICNGESVTFTASITNLPTCFGSTKVFESITYQWFIGTNNVGSGNTFSTSTLKNGEEVKCNLYYAYACQNFTQTVFSTKSSNIITTSVKLNHPDLRITNAETQLINNQVYTFSVASTSIPNLSYFWDVPFNVGSIISGQNTPSIQVITGADGSSGEIRVSSYATGCPPSSGVSATPILVNVRNPPPSYPANFRISSVNSNTSLTLSWDASTDNTSIQRYWVQYKGGNIIGNYITLQTTGTSITLNGLQEGSIYRFFIEAQDTEGTFSNGTKSLPLSSPNQGVGFADYIDVTPPTAPTNLFVTQATNSKIALVWNEPSDNVRTTSYDIYQNNVLVSENYARTMFVANVTDSPNIFTIRAKDAKGNISVASLPLYVKKLDAINVDTATGNVGIGIIPASERLHVSGNIKIEDGSLIFKGTPTLNSHIFAETGDLKIQSTPTTVGNTVINQYGGLLAVGVATPTTEAAVKLQVGGKTIINGDADIKGKILQNGQETKTFTVQNNYNTLDGNTNIKGLLKVGTNSLYLKGYNAPSDPTNEVYADGNLLIQSNTANTASHNTIINQNAGNVGIGIASPSAKLEVIGGIGGGIANISTNGRYRSTREDGGIYVGANGMFIGGDGNNNIGFYNGNNWRLLVSQTGNVSANGLTLSNLAGLGNRMVIANATGGLSTQAIPLATQWTNVTGGISYASNVTLSNMAGTGNRMVIANSAGVLSTQSIPSSQWTNITGGITYANKVGIGVSAVATSVQLQVSNRIRVGEGVEIGDNNKGIFFVNNRLVLWQGAERLSVLANGSIGIGTSTTTVNNVDYLVAVNGRLIARGIRSQPATWADFVFDSEYKLKDLYEVEKQLKTDHHLEGIPSEKEVLNNGIDHNEIFSKLLKNLEEDRLYIIQLKKENDALLRRIEALEKK